MGQRQRYVKRHPNLVVAVRLDLVTDGFTYNKWGHEQHCKAGDWLVNNAGDVYSVDAQTFAQTYVEVTPGQFRKVAPVWAEQASQAGVVLTKEGATDYGAGDYLVSNRADGSDAYAVTRERFEMMYVLDESDDTQR